MAQSQVSELRGSEENIHRFMSEQDLGRATEAGQRHGEGGNWNELCSLKVLV